MYKYLALLLLFLSQFGELSSQVTIFEKESKTFSTDTACAKYTFYPNDTLVYQIIAFDSVSVNYDLPLLRNRKEIVMFICDSIDKNMKYHFSQYMLEYTAKESSKERQNVEILEHPWLYKKINFTIDQTGKRYTYGVDDSTTAILAPGGAFTPHLFFDLGIYCNQIDINWNVRTNDEIPENGVPFPLFNSMTLFKFREPLDTLGQEVNRLEFIRTGQASYEFPIKDSEKGTITGKTNEFGLLDISKVDEIPIHYYSTKEIKVSINQKRGRILPGYNYHTTYFTLIKYSSPEKMKLKNKKK